MLEEQLQPADFPVETRNLLQPLAQQEKTMLRRKTFEYGESFMCHPYVRRLERILLSDHRTIAETDGFWRREHASFLVARSVFGCSYEDYLPGRVYTYRRFAQILRNQADFISLIDVGCGSGMMLHECGKLGCRVTGIDRSFAALSFAQALGQEYSTHNLMLRQADVMRNGCSGIESHDVVSNLGSLEHLAFEEQIIFVETMKRLSKRWVAIAVPNFDSTAFEIMESAEQKLNTPDLIYPEQSRAFPVDFESIALATRLSLIGIWRFHLPPTSISYRSLVLEGRSAFYKDLCHDAENSSGDPISIWLNLEDHASLSDINKHAWFRFALFSL